MDTALRAMVDLRDRTLQKTRIAFGLRLDAVSRGADQMEQDDLSMMQRWFDKFQELENECEDQIKDIAKDDAIIDAMINVKGIGLMLAAKVVSMIDIERASSVSALWRYSGYAVIDGEREKPTKGEKLHYNARLKSSCYLVGGSFLKCNSPYRAIYDSAKEFYQANKPEWTKAHIHNASMRKMIKMWLSHLWLVWRELRGLPTNMPYVNEKLNHTHYYSPKEFGWHSEAITSK